MYRLQILRADRWSILDQRDDEVFQGTLSECEAWLDRAENHATSAGPLAGRRHGFRDWFRRWWNPGRPIAPLISPGAQAASSQVPHRS